jgi:hypothetical protein
MDPAFSRRGEPATPFERELLQHRGTPPAHSEQELWVELVQRVGLDALLHIFDDMGGRKVWIPTRETFIRLVWSDLRDAEIHRLHAASMTINQIATRMGLNQRTVRHVVQRRPFSAAAKRAKQRA